MSRPWRQLNHQRRLPYLLRTEAQTLHDDHFPDSKTPGLLNSAGRWASRSEGARDAPT